jgi:hypothetical protein
MERARSVTPATNLRSIRFLSSNSSREVLRETEVFERDDAFAYTAAPKIDGIAVK